MQGEGLKTTAHNKIFIGDIEDVTEKQLEEKIAILKEIIQDENIEKEKIRQTMKKIVPTYHEPEEVNSIIKNSRKELEEKSQSKAKDVLQKLAKTNESKQLKTTV